MIRCRPRQNIYQSAYIGGTLASWRTWGELPRLPTWADFDAAEAASVGRRLHVSGPWHIPSDWDNQLMSESDLEVRRGVPVAWRTPSGRWVADHRAAV
jgi:hypothetical protein